MRYVSTRGRVPPIGFEQVLLEGLARDGGLYLPEAWPRMDESDIAALAGLPYGRAAARVAAPFLDDDDGRQRFAAIAGDAYGTFGHPATAPLRQLGDNDWLLELFHGPTLAFKDYALQLLGRLFDDLLGRLGRRITIVGATSGDTGSAAIEACRGRRAIEIFILHPQGRVSEVQRRQMTTVADDNVHNIAVEGTFDDCQALVKAMFNDPDFRDDLRLSAVNSINWARVMAQIVYYVTAGVALGAPRRAVAFVVPTGNFGDVFAGYAAMRMGLPVARLVVATNRNDIVARFLQTGAYARGAVAPTMSPSMDIQVAGNFERLLFDLLGRDGAAVSERMEAFARDGAFTVGGDAMAEVRERFRGYRVDETGTSAAIRRTLRETGLLVDPHTAVGLAAARACRRAGGAAVPPEAPLVTLATAHPAKFPEAVERSCGVRPETPARLAEVFDRAERYTVLPADLGRVRGHIRERANP